MLQGITLVRLYQNNISHKFDDYLAPEPENPVVWGCIPTKIFQGFMDHICEQLIVPKEYPSYPPSVARIDPKIQSSFLCASVYLVL